MSGASDRRLEAGLREVLASARPGLGAPAELRARIERLPMTSRPAVLPTRVRTAISAAGWVSGLAAAGVLGVVAVSRAMNLPAVPYADPGVGSSVPNPSFDPSIAGPGIVTSVALLQGWVPWVVAGLAWVVLAAVATRGWRRRRAVIVAALALALGLGAGAFKLATHPGLAFAGAYGPVFGLDVIAEAPRASSGPSVWYVTAEKGDPFVFAIVLTNPGPLPVRYLGVYEPVEPLVHIYHWSAVWQVDNSGGGVPVPTAASSFHPVDIAPMESLTIYLVARASDCVFGHGFRLADAAQFSFASRESFSVAYSVAGLTSTAVIELPAVIAEPRLGNCPAA